MTIFMAAALPSWHLLSLLFAAFYQGEQVQGAMPYLAIHCRGFSVIDGGCQAI
jgi:hypothetical protein